MYVFRIPLTCFSKPLGWAGHVRIDNTTYRWLGQASGPNSTTLTDTTITPTQTIWTIRAGPMDLTVTFLTPIEVCEALVSVQSNHSHLISLEAGGLGPAIDPILLSLI